MPAHRTVDDVRADTPGLASRGDGRLSMEAPRVNDHPRPEELGRFRTHVIGDSVSPRANSHAAAVSPAWFSV